MHAGERLCVVAHSTILVCLRKILLRLDEQATDAIARHEHPRNCALGHFTSTRQDDTDTTYQPAAVHWRMDEWDHVVYGTELASVVPDHQQRQATPGENG